MWQNISKCDHHIVAPRQFYKDVSCAAPSVSSGQTPALSLDENYGQHNNLWSCIMLQARTQTMCVLRMGALVACIISLHVSASSHLDHMGALAKCFRNRWCIVFVCNTVIVLVLFHTVISHSHCLQSGRFTRIAQLSFSVVVRLPCPPVAHRISLPVFASSHLNHIRIMDGCIDRLFPYRLVRKKSPHPFPPPCNVGRRGSVE